MNFEIHFHEKLKKENHDCRTVDIQVRTINVTLLFCNSLPWETHLPYKKKIPFLVKKNLLQILLWFFKGKKIMFLPSSKKRAIFSIISMGFLKIFLRGNFFCLAVFKVLPLIYYLKIKLPIFSTTTKSFRFHEKKIIFSKSPTPFTSWQNL